MSLLQTTEETLRLTKEALADNSLAKTVTDLDRPHRLRSAGAGEEPLPDHHAAPESLPRVQRALNPATPRAGARSPRSPARATTRWAGFRKASARPPCPTPRRSMVAPYRDARRRRHGHLRSRSRRAGLRRRQRHRDAAPAAEDDAQGGDARCSAATPPWRSARPPTPTLSAPRARARRCPPPPIRSSWSR